MAVQKAPSDLFIWRLNIEKPSVIILGIDTTVMDNEDATRREGVKYTYKRIKGFQPLEVYYNSYVIDSVFRGGDKHSNYKDAVVKSIRHIVNYGSRNKRYLDADKIIETYPTSSSISPNVFRRRFIDFAARITHTGRKIILKITRWVWKRINISYLWERCNNPPYITVTYSA